MADEPQISAYEACRKLVKEARKLGLFGVVILSPRCPDCGNLHDFEVATSLKADDDAKMTRRSALVHFLRDRADDLEDKGDDMLSDDVIAARGGHA